MMALPVGPCGLLFGCRSSILAFVFALGVEAIAAPSGARAGDILISLDEARLVKMPEKAVTIVIGNPLIADATVQPGGLMVLTGKGYGSTNVVVLDRIGAVLMEKTVEVIGPRDTVVVYRGILRETYSCNPFCQPRITLGDSPENFNRSLAQTMNRNDQAHSIAPSR